MKQSSNTKVYQGAVARRPNSGANDAKGTCRPIHRRTVQIRKSPSIEGLHVNVVRLVNFQGAYSPRQVKRLLAVDQTTRYTGSFDCILEDYVWFSRIVPFPHLRLYKNS